MNKVSEFLEKAIYSPQEFLGVNQFAAIDLTVEFLRKTSKTKENKRILVLTVDSLYNHLTDEMLLQYKSDNPVFSCINKLLGSSWENETVVRLIELYFVNYEREQIYTYLEVLIINKEAESQYLVKERLYDYFGQNISMLSEIEKVIYCIHVLNVSFGYHKGEYDFINPEFKQLVTDNIIKLTDTNSSPINRVAIWTLYWLVGSMRKTKSIIKIDLKLRQHVCFLLDKKQDIRSKLRLAVILIKSSKNLQNKIDKSLTAQWAMNIINRGITRTSSGILSFKYSQIIENCFLEALNLKDKFWLYEISIPYLGLMASSKAILILTDNLKLNGPIKINSAIVLSGLGSLTINQIESFNIKKSEIFDEIIRTNSELCYQVMGKDTTGRTAWYFVLLDKQKKDEFMAHGKGDNYDLADYGSIIESGYGESVPDHVKEMLREKYGFDNF